MEMLGNIFTFFPPLSIKRLTNSIRKNMNVFCQNGGDPLLYQRPTTSLFNDDMNIPQQNNLLNNSTSLDDITKAYNRLMMDAQQNPRNMQQQSDWIGDLDNKIKSLDDSVASIVASNREYKQLNNELQSVIQNELMANVKNKLNCNQNVINNVQKQMAIIKTAESQVKDEEKRNMSELTDYMKNYSNITFDEYRRIKNGGNASNSQCNTPRATQPTSNEESVISVEDCVKTNNNAVDADSQIVAVKDKKSFKDKIKDCF